jgi:hypothetical protein
MNMLKLAKPSRLARCGWVALAAAAPIAQAAASSFAISFTYPGKPADVLGPQVALSGTTTAPVGNALFVDDALACRKDAQFYVNDIPFVARGQSLAVKWVAENGDVLPPTPN